MQQPYDHYQIMGQSDQVLQLLLPPKAFCYISGTVLYGSTGIYTKQKQTTSYLYKWMGRHFTLRKIENASDFNQYIGIKRNEGKILALDVELYGTMLVKLDKVLAIDYQFGPQVFHDKLRDFIILECKKVDQTKMVFLQGGNNLYVEKSLAQGEKMSFQRQSLIAMSSSVGVLESGPTLNVEGPGFVFLSTAEINKHQATYGRIILGVVIILMIESFLAGFWFDP